VLVKLAQLLRVGRFQRWDAATAGRATSKLARLTLIFGRNASGKSTLVRTLRAAASGSAEDVLLDRTLDATQPPNVQLDFTAGPYKFDGTAWKGAKPTIHVFDRKFVEDNVFVGTLSSKRHRTQILQIALGAEEVSLAVNLDQLSKHGRELANEEGHHDRLVRAMVAKHAMTELAFLALSPVDDLAAARAALDTRGHEASIERELEHRARPTALPMIPRLDFAVLGTLLATTTTEVAAAVRAHFDKRLRGNGEAWVRAGLAFADGKTCPFCAQSVAGNSGDLINAFADHFDRAYVDLAGAIDIALAATRSIATWWSDVAKTAQINVRAIDAWGDPIAFDASARSADAAAVAKQLTALLEAKAKRPTQAVATEALADVRIAYERLVTAATDYDVRIDAIRATIAKRLDAVATARAAGASAAAAIAAERRRLDAAVDRYSEPIVRALAERARLAGEIARIDAAKKHAVDEMHKKKLGQLAQFTARMNELLGMLCADFTLEELETERSGGTTGARFTVRIPAGRVSVASADGEAKFARVLSDGDRSTLALALFVVAIERTPDLGEAIVVFDDPMTSQDAQRSEATAEQITRLAKRVDQVIVVSHLAPFLLQVAYDWRRHGGEVKALAELELDRAAMTLHSWSAEDHATDEHARRAAELRAFATDPASDAFAPRMHGEIRKLVEHRLRETHPELGALTLEAFVRHLRGDAELLAAMNWTADELEELDRLTAFTARAGVSPAPEPEVVRGMARRALALVER
jgi:wobble nucleotide-excising tRNase